MLINDIENKDELFNIIVHELRDHGIKYRKEKKAKHGQEKVKCKRIFHMPLHSLELADVVLANGGIVQVPILVKDACQRILENTNTEGLFRKAGSTKRQQEIKATLEAGQPLGKNHHVIDVANILKTFFRDLPEAILPYGSIQESLLRCLLSGGENKIYDILITCLLLPPLTLNTLAFFMQFLYTVSRSSDTNKMSIENLALIITPNIMPIAEMIQQRLNSHVKVVQLLIENSHQIGVVPDRILEKCNDSFIVLKSKNLDNTNLQHTDRKKKKRRSGSLTRMFNGLKKIVGGKGSTENLDKTNENMLDVKEMATPCLTKSAKKRKVADANPFSAKKKKDILSSMPDSNNLLPCTPLIAAKEHKKSRLSLGGNKKHNKNARLLPSSSIIFSVVESSKPMERRWSVVGAPWTRKNKNNQAEENKESMKQVGCTLSPIISLPCLATPDFMKSESNIRPLPSSKSLFQEDEIHMDIDIKEKTNGRPEEEEYVKISRSEYEAFKERVHAIETRISQEFGKNEFDRIEDVQEKYEEVLQETEPIEASCSTTDQLAKRLSRDLKIRRSEEHKTIRSPSARKIGSIRRRSRENIRLSRNQSWNLGSSCANIAKTNEFSFYPKSSNLKRGRPNTVQTGLKHPSPPVQEQKEKEDENWTAAEAFFSHPELMEVPCTPEKPKDDDSAIFKTPEIPTPRRQSLRSSNSARKTPQQVFITNIEIGEAKTPMLPPSLPPRKTPGKTPMLPPKTPGLSKTMLTPLQEVQSGRASIARLRCQNAGQVMAKAKLFDGIAEKTNSAHTRRQSTKFVIKKKSIEPRNSAIHKIRSGVNSTTRSPRRSTPRKRQTTKSPHTSGGINRRQQLRLVKSPANTLNSPKISRILDENSYFSPKMHDLNSELTKTPHIKKQLMKNSPRRILKTPNRDNIRTPLKAQPISALTLDSELHRRQSPRLIHNNSLRP